MRRYTNSHEWFEADDAQPGLVRIGISTHAAEQLGDVVFVELPEKGRAVQQEEGMAVIESVKAVADLYAPFAGTITGVNGDLADNPGTVTSDPEQEGWILLLQAQDPSDVEKTGMTPDEYKAKLDAEG